jgi:transglutaminase-like putative cysteine protease
VILHIKHTTRYTYSAPVFCEPMLVRLRPRSDAAQRLEYFALSVDPAPAGTSDVLELDGHVATRIWFEGLTCALAVTTLSVVETMCTNPFAFLLDLSARQLPLEYPAAKRLQLAPYLLPIDANPELARLAQQLAAESNHDTLGFLFRLTEYLHFSNDRINRFEDSIQTPSQTLALRSGACRDLAVLWIDMCRHVGLAARFVSGYQVSGPDELERHLHAWCEVYLPGAGWRAYDPSQGLAVADGHVAVAAGPVAELAAPTVGSYRGSGVRATMRTQLQVACQPAAQPQQDLAMSMAGIAGSSSLMQTMQGGIGAGASSGGRVLPR